MTSTRRIEIPNLIIGDVFGKFDENIRKIERAFSVMVVNRGDSVLISGEKSEKAEKIILKLTDIARSGEAVTEQNVNYLIASVEDDEFGDIDKLTSDVIAAAVTGKLIRPKTLGQKKYVDGIRKNAVTLGIGPAGTGKTYIAMAMAVTAFKNGEAARIILTRPAIEAGEKLGFLPGDLQQKVDPYLRPLYDALYEIMGAETFQRNLEKGAVEVAPLAYMRGRTLDNAFIVLDEAQNTTPEQMKMFLTRVGFGSKAVITGDITQIDLPEGKRSGLVEAASVLKGVDDISVIRLTQRDVVRRPLVQKIIEAYDRYERNKERSRSKRR
ncbi:MAG: PhoH family protein [Clostridiales bacterium]|jgi:phosphate starvation-inducible PhoH-like protein|nr:PhoH family protein [Clostridiales bacterium]